MLVRSLFKSVLFVFVCFSMILSSQREPVTKCDSLIYSSKEAKKILSKMPFLINSESEYQYAKKFYMLIDSICPNYLSDSIDRKMEDIFWMCEENITLIKTALDKYQQAKAADEASEAEEKANKENDISDLSDKICSDIQMLKDLNKQLAYEDEVEKAGGVRDLGARRSLAEAKVMANMTIKNDKAKYFNLTGKQWTSSHCKKENE